MPCAKPLIEMGRKEVSQINGEKQQERKKKRTGSQNTSSEQLQTMEKKSKNAMCAPKPNTSRKHYGMK